MNMTAFVVQHRPDNITGAIENFCGTDYRLGSGECRNLVAVDTIDDTTEPRSPHSTSTHWTGFRARVHHHLCTFVGIVLLARTVREVEFGMSPDVIFGDDTIRIGHDDCIVADEYGPERSIASSGGLSSEFEGRSHMRVMIELIEGGARHTYR